METRWHLADDLDAWLDQALSYVRLAEAEALARHGEFHICLAGGATPRRLHEALARGAHDWTHWHIWLGDERCLPENDPERNSILAAESLVRSTAIPPGQVHVIPAELGAEIAARYYAEALTNIGSFDLVLLGLGEDGHTASLFPDHDWGAAADAPDALPMFDAPKPPPERVTLSARRLARAHRVLFLVSGASKREAVARWRQGDPIPASAIRPECGVDVLLTAESCPPGEMP